MHCAGGAIGDRHHFSLWKSCVESTEASPQKRAEKHRYSIRKEELRERADVDVAGHTLQRTQEEG
jgi:hypothetical protein